MGGLFGGWLAGAGNDVTLIDVSAPAIDAINRDGLQVEARDGTRKTIPVRATSDPESVGVVDVIVSFVKCYHTDAAIRSAAPMLGPDTVVLSLQNGWGNAARLGAVVGEDRVLVGLTYHSGTLVAPGRVKQAGAGVTHLGEMAGGSSERADRIVAAFSGAGIDTAASPRILDEIWKKLALNACTLPTAALLRLTADKLVAYDGVQALMQAILAEVVAVATAQGIALDGAERWEAITSVLRRAIGGRPSMLQDVEARRQTEIDVINGAIVAAGQRTGVATPHNEAMVWLVTALEQNLAEQAA